MVNVGAWFPPKEYSLMVALAKHFDGNVSMAVRVAVKEALEKRNGHAK